MARPRYRVESNCVVTESGKRHPMFKHVARKPRQWDIRVPLHKSNLKNRKARVTFPTIEEAIGFVRTLQMRESSPRPDKKPLPWYNEHRIVQIADGKETVIREFPVDPELMNEHKETAP